MPKGFTRATAVVMSALVLTAVSVSTVLIETRPSPRWNSDRFVRLQHPRNVHHNVPPVTDAEFQTAEQAVWVWAQNPMGNYWFCVPFTVPSDSTRGRLKAACSGRCTVYLNGHKLGQTSGFENPIDLDVTPWLVTDWWAHDNLLEVDARSDQDQPMLAVAVVMKDEDNKLSNVGTSTCWTGGALRRGDQPQSPLKVYATLRDMPWPSRDHSGITLPQASD